MAEGFMKRLREFFNDTRKPLTLPEFAEFYRNLSDEDRADYERQLDELSA